MKKLDMRDELEEQTINLKLMYLNGYLEALSIMNSYYPIDMNYKLFSFNYSEENLLEIVNQHSYQLFDNAPNTYSFNLKAITSWKESVFNELSSNFWRRIPSGKDNSLDYRENDLVDEYKKQYNSSFNIFIEYFNDNLITPETEAYQLDIDTKGKFYTIVGMNLVFVVSSIRFILLRMIGSD